MFICDPCLHKHYENNPLLISSFVRCEVCKGHARCNDIPSGNLIRKKSVNAINMDELISELDAANKIILNMSNAISSKELAKNTDFTRVIVRMQEFRSAVDHVLCQSKDKAKETKYGRKKSLAKGISK